jgi:hypothetical protein
MDRQGAAFHLKILAVRANGGDKESLNGRLAQPDVPRTLH